MTTEYVCFEQRAPSIDRRCIDIAEGTIKRLLKDYHFRRLESAHGPITIHWYRVKTAADRALELGTGFEQETVTTPDDRHLIGFFKYGDGSLIHLRADIAYKEVARTVVHELAHADNDPGAGSAGKSLGAWNYDADESQAVQEEIRLNRYHRGVVW
jgi:hypothetical protein